MERMYPIEMLITEGVIPERFREVLNHKCTDKNCGYPLVVNEALTRKRCVNPACPMHMKYRAAEVLRFLKVTGIGEETCYGLIVNNKLTSHFQVIPLVLAEKPRMELWQVAKYCFTPDISDGWVNHLGGRSDPEGLPRDLQMYESTIRNAMQYFDIVQHSQKDFTVHIAVHGGLGTYGSRDDFPSLCNALVGNRVNTILKSSVTNTVHFLVTYQPNDTSCAKVKKALERGVDIVTPEQYIAWMARQSAGLSTENQE
jgi:NAD-dependent DNA ligase